MIMKRNIMLGINIGLETLEDIQKNIFSFLKDRKKRYYHLVNLNPDIFVLAYENSGYREIINSADSVLIDGIGIQMAALLLGRKYGERMTGTDFMSLLVRFAEEKNKRVLFLGGAGDSADLTCSKFKKQFLHLQCTADSGVRDITNETEKESQRVRELIKLFKPDFLFVAYGPPFQEKWIYRNRESLKGIVCMGVGGAFKLISGQVKRAPIWMTRNGLEWVWRFLVEPGRLFTKLPRYLHFIQIIGGRLIKNLGKTDQ